MSLLLNCVWKSRSTFLIAVVTKTAYKDASGLLSGSSVHLFMEIEICLCLSDQMSFSDKI